jgi:FdhE protein
MVRAGQTQSATREVIAAQWDRRIERARTLETVYPFASEGLRFYQQLAREQRLLYSDLESVLNSAVGTEPGLGLRQELDLDFLLPRLSRFLAVIAEASPSPLARSASAMRSQSGGHLSEMLSRFWQSDSFPAAQIDPAQAFVSWAFLQPYAEYLARHYPPEKIEATPFTCPLCDSNPIVGVLRREGDGAKKSLVCMLCAHEWAFRRLLCPACGEEREPQLAFYAAPEISHVRVDVCDTCHTYLKAIDLTKTGLAVPVVDELATIPLDVWARQHGYQKLQINLLGT